MHSERALLLDLGLIAVAIFGSACLFLPHAGDPVNVGKLTLITFCSVALAANAAWRGVRLRSLSLLWGVPALAGLLLAAALLVATVASPNRTTALVGAYGRNSGLYAYASALVLYGAVLRSASRKTVPLLLGTLVAAAAFTAGYGLLQYVGVDAIHWNNPFNPIIAALGNPDFASGYLGICAPAAAWAALNAKLPAALRCLSALVLAGSLAAAVLSAAVQGPFAAAAGLSVLGLARLLNAQLTAARNLVAAFAAATAVAVGLMASGVAGHGPFAPIFARPSFRARTWYWQASITMWRRRPIQGIGLDAYGTYWRRDRPIAAVQHLGANEFSDAAHSVPLQHLAEGGLLLALTYLFFVMITAAALVKGLRALDGADRLLLGGIGGAWIGYQVQSLVSIDQVPLLVLNFVLAAGVIVTAGQARLRLVPLPGRATAQVARGRSRTVTPSVRPLTPVDVVLGAGLLVLSCLAVSSALTPLRASYAFFDAEVAFTHGDGNAAVAAYRRAMSLEPGVGNYPARLGQLYVAAKANALAVPAFKAAFEAEPSQVFAARQAAKLAEEGGDVTLADRLLSEAVHVDPHNADTVLDFAWFQTRHERPEQARGPLAVAVREFPKDARLWSALGDVDAAAGDDRSARRDYDHALLLQPREPGATAGLSNLLHRR